MHARCVDADGVNAVLRSRLDRERGGTRFTHEAAHEAPGSDRALAGANPFFYNRLAVLLITPSRPLRTSSGSGVKSSPGLMKRSSSKPACFS